MDPNSDSPQVQPSDSFLTEPGLQRPPIAGGFERTALLVQRQAAPASPGVTHPKNINSEMVSLPRLIFSHCPTSSHQQFIVLQDTSCSSATMHWWCPRQKTRWVWCWHLQPEPSILLACSGQAAWPSETYQQWESQANLATLTTCEGSSGALWKKCVSYAHKHYIYIYTYIYKYMC